MSMLVVTCATGNQAMADMTRTMLSDLGEAIKLCEGLKGRITVYAQDVVGKGLMPSQVEGFVLHLVRSKKNRGFAHGMNAAYHAGLLAESNPPEWVLCLNNDLRMPDHYWLANLLKEADGAKVLTPTTNFTGTKEQERSGTRDENAFNHGVTPAICWLLPWEACMRLARHYGKQQLFREDFGPAWGEDNYASAVLRKSDPKPFRVVPRAWVRHIGSVTSSKVAASDRIRANNRAMQAIKDEGLPGG